MSTIEQQPAVAGTPRTQRKGTVLASWLSSTDHKIIGHLYLITSFFFFLCAGIMALLMRIQLMGPDQHFVSDQQYNELFTMHGTLMLLLFATPLFIGFSNELIPLQIGAPDVAFPRLNLLSYYLFAFGGLILLASFLTPGGSAAFGWYAYAPLTSAIYSPGVGADTWTMGLVLSGLGTILGAVNFITTIFCMRAPGMTMFRMPIFTWNALLTSMLALMAFPVLAAALLVLEIDRRLGAQVFDAASGGAILWQNPVLVLRPPGGVHPRDPVLRHRDRDHPGVQPQAAVRLQGHDRRDDRDHRAVDDRVGASHVHHRRGAAAVLLALCPSSSRCAHRGEVLQLDRHHVARPAHLRAADAVLDRVPGRVLVRRNHRSHPGLAAAGLRGVRLVFPGRALPLRAGLATVLFAMFAGAFYFWWPKMTGTMLNSRLGKIQFWVMFIGYHMTFLVQHWIGVEGMPRRVANYPFLPGNVTTLNIISSVGSWILALSILVFFWNIYVTWRHGVQVTEEDPWGYCSSLEWATSCPPPRHNFYRIPRIRSERPAFEAHYPDIKWGRESRGLEQTIPSIPNTQK